MERLVLAALSTCLLLVPFGSAEEWSKTYTITGKPDLRVETSDADIRVDKWDQNTIEAHLIADGYKIGEHGIKITEHQTGDSVDIEVRFPVHIVTFNFKGHRVQLDIHMPREGRVNLHTGDGSIHVANLKGTMELETGDGHEEIEAVDGILRAKSGDGHVNATGRFDELNITTGDGQIEARALTGSTIASSWTLHTGDGNVTLELPDNLPADVELRTGDGHITLGIPVMVEGKLGEKNIHGKINGGGNLLTVHTGDGSIRLDKS
jgi:DUF4097 and DUF4098 domain-containing protein YvlB